MTEAATRKLNPEAAEASRFAPHTLLRKYLWNQSVMNSGTNRGDLLQDAWGFFARADKFPAAREHLSYVVIDHMLRTPNPDFALIGHSLPALSPMREFEILGRIATTPELSDAVPVDQWNQWWMRASSNTAPLSEVYALKPGVHLGMLARNNAELAINLHTATSETAKIKAAKSASEQLEEIEQHVSRYGYLQEYREDGVSKTKISPTVSSLDFYSDLGRLFFDFYHMAGTAGYWEGVSYPALSKIYRAASDALEIDEYDRMSSLRSDWERATSEDRRKTADALVPLLAAGDPITIEAVSNSPQDFYITNPEIRESLRRLLPGEIREAIGIQEHEERRFDLFTSDEEATPEQAVNTYLLYERRCSGQDPNHPYSDSAIRAGLHLVRISSRPGFSDFYLHESERTTAGTQTDELIASFERKKALYGDSVTLSDDEVSGVDNLVHNLSGWNSETSIRNHLRIIELLSCSKQFTQAQIDSVPHEIMSSLVHSINTHWLNLCARASKTAVVEELNPVIEKLLPLAFQFSNGYSDRWGYAVPEKILNTV